MDDFNFLEDDVASVAKRLLGCYLIRDFGGKQIKIRISETEAYDQNDMASHSYNGLTKRNEVMFGAAGKLYVYFTYGMHYCMNVVVGPEGIGAAVLIRAASVVSGSDLVKMNRGNVAEKDLTNGPAKLCQALKVDKSLNGHDLKRSPLMLELGNLSEKEDVLITPRIGISRAKDSKLRFVLM
jgi:DNA-3-methyladenine glycosylase